MKSSWVQRSQTAGCLVPLSLFSAILFLLFLILGFPHPAQAAPGDLDATFGTGGIVTTSFGTIDDDAYALAIQADGKSVAAGYSNTGGGVDVFALARYN